MYEDRPPLKFADEKQFYMLFGGPHTAITWMTAMLQGNLSVPCKFGRDSWGPCRFYGCDEGWRRARPGIYGNVGMSGHMYWPYIRDSFNPTVAFLWREPLSQAAGMIRHLRCDQHQRNGWFERSLYLMYSAYEMTLHSLAREGRPATNWHFDHYTTLDGFKDMCAELKLPLKLNVNYVNDGRDSKKDKVPIAQYEDFVMSVRDLFPRCKAAYEEACQKVGVVHA